jgi:hypothetical protein
MLQRHVDFSTGPFDLSNRILDNGIAPRESVLLETLPDPLGGMSLLPVGVLVLL